MLPERETEMTGRKAGEKGKGREAEREAQGITRKQTERQRGASCVHLADRRDSPDHEG